MVDSVSWNAYSTWKAWRWFDRCQCCTELWLPCRRIRATSMIQFMAKNSPAEDVEHSRRSPSDSVLHKTNNFLSDLDVCVIVENSRKWIFLELNWTQFIYYYRHRPPKTDHWTLTTKHTPLDFDHRTFDLCDRRESMNMNIPGTD